MNDIDRFSLVNDVIDRVPGLAERTAYAKQVLRDKQIDHREYTRRYGDDMPRSRTGLRAAGLRPRAAQARPRRKRPRTSALAGRIRNS